MTLHLAVDIGDRETAFFSGFHDVARLSDARIDEHQRRRGVLAHIDDGHAAGDADLIRREPNPFGGVHRLEQIVHQPAHGVVNRGDRGGELSQDGRAEQVELADGHCGLATSTERLRMFAMLAR